MTRTKLCCFAAFVPIGAAVLFHAAEPASAAPSFGGRLIVTSFLQSGRTDVRRNEVLEIRFSGRLRKGSVDLRTVQVNELVPTGRQPAIGARIVRGNIVYFTPRRTQRNYDESRLPKSPVIWEDHPLGFSANALYEVRVRAGNDVTSVRGHDGRRLAAKFVTTFGTGALYDDPVPGQPEVGGAGGTGQLAWDPPASSTTGLVDDDARLVFRFSEPIDASTLRLGDTVRVTRYATGEAVPGAIAASPFNASRFYFEPAGGWDAAAGGPNVHVELTTGITDLAGIPLKQPFSTQ